MDPEGGQGVRIPPPLKNHKNIWFLSNTGLGPLKYHKATKPAFNVGPSSARHRNAMYMAFHWQANDGPILVVFGKKKKKLDPLWKNSGAAHGRSSKMFHQDPHYLLGWKLPYRQKIQIIEILKTKSDPFWTVNNFFSELMLNVPDFSVISRCFPGSNQRIKCLYRIVLSVNWFTHNHNKAGWEDRTVRVLKVLKDLYSCPIYIINGLKTYIPVQYRSLMD